MLPFPALHRRRRTAFTGPLGVEVILMDRRTDIMRMLDEEIGEIFANYIKQIGVERGVVELPIVLSVLY